MPEMWINSDTLHVRGERRRGTAKHRLAGVLSGQFSALTSHDLLGLWQLGEA